MEAIKLTEPPSLVRRRLSMSSSFAPGSISSLRRTSIRANHPSLASDANNLQTNRISIAPRRASALSRMFALPSTSESFLKENVLPTIITAMIFLDDPNPNVVKLREMLTERLLDIPRFRCVVKDDGNGGMIWEPLARDDVDMTQHLVTIDGQKTFGHEDIENLINDTYLSDWGVDLPLWRSKLVTNLNDGRSLLFVSIDHTIGDGVGLLSVFLSLFDDSLEDGDKDNKVAQKARKKPQGLSLSYKVVAFLNGIKDGFVNSLIPPKSDPPSCLMIPKHLIADACPGKAFAQTRAFPLKEIKRLKNKMSGSTVNDVVMALMIMTIHKYYQMKGDIETLDLIRKGKKSIRALFPVNMRRGNTVELCNDIVNGKLVCPGDFQDPVDCVWKVKTIVDTLKISPAFHIQKMIVDIFLKFVPDTALSSQFNDLLNKNTCMLSNVMGPAGEASLCGYAINDLNFTCSYGGGLYFGVLSYGGNLRISGILDQRASGDVKELMRCFEETYDELSAVLESVDETEPLKCPDMTSVLARALELLFYTAIVMLPVFVASKYFR